MADRRRCRFCDAVVPVLAVRQVLRVHWVANPAWQPGMPVTAAVLQCRGSGGPCGLHVPVAGPPPRPRGTCPGCYRAITLTKTGALRRHACEAGPRHGEPVAARQPLARAIRVREEGE